MEEQDKKDRVPDFMKGATAMVKHLLSIFNDLQFYVGENYDMEGSMGFSW